jgi:TRAP-type transport system periplasmic protein
VTERASDGKPGALIVKQIESKLRVKVVGPWIDLGFQNWYTTRKPLKSIEDIRGLKIRSPGGAGISWRIAFCGGIPSTVAWPSVPRALLQGTFDGFVSTNESCVTAKLWEAGVRYSYQDHQYVGQYMPLISQIFWSKLTPDVQKIMADLWFTNISGYRANASAAQARARRMLEDKGVTFVDPSPKVLADTRKRMQADVATLVRDARLSPDIVRLSEESVNSSA